MNIYIIPALVQKKNGKHSVKEFIDIMNKNFNIECSEFIQDFNYKPCILYKEMNRKAFSYYMKHNKSLFNKTMTKKNKKLLKECDKYKKTAKKIKCDVDQYIKFSGAEKKN